MQEIISKLVQKNSTKIVFCVLDGLGGLPLNDKTELQAANTPNLDELVNSSSVGLHTPVAAGITPGSGAAHLGLFGYNPLNYEIGRGVLEALGLGIKMGPRDIAIRGNFATVKYEGNNPIITDRRAGRIPTEENIRIINMLSENISDIEGVHVTLYSGLEHRFVVIFTFPEILKENSGLIHDTDPQKEGVAPIVPRGENDESEKVADIINKFVIRSSEILKDETSANYPLLRGISVYPHLSTYEQVYGLKAGCIATYPMYKGVSKLVGMDVLEVRENSIKSEIETLKKNFGIYDFFYIHIKKTDSYGED
ncbi:MAG: 2,3-bisphosphoglycerate-independent phosphoglycerate mutase, partial [Thermodesulfobacteriota bacterium]